MFLVLGSPDGEPREVEVLLDGEPIADADAGDDVSGRQPRRSPTSASTGSSTCPEAGRHTLELRFDDGIEGYAFTFG